MAGGGGADSRWLITYGDLVTLLMAFFIALYGISHSDAKKFNDFLKGLGAFGNPAAANSGILKGGPSIVGVGTGVGQANPGKVTVGSSGGTALGAGATPAPALGTVTATATTLASGAAGATTLHASQGDLAAVATNIQQALQAAGLGSSVTLTVESRGLVATIATDHVLFDTGSAEVNAAGERIIAAIAPTLVRLTNPVLIEGYTDNVPLNSNGYTNWNLSTDRAVAVLQTLQTTYGIDPTRLSGAGYGQYHPLASDATPQGRAANRRVQIVILTSAPGTATP
jgi:chemotaxis protein MotB